MASKSYSLNINRENPLFKQAIGDVMIQRELTDGTKRRSKYRGKLIPGVFRHKRIKWNESKREYPISLAQKDLDAIVKRLNLVDDEGKLIKTADKYNRRDPFFSHDELYYNVDSETKRMLEDDPLDKLFLNYFQNVRGEVHLYEDEETSQKSDTAVYADYVLLEDQTLDEAIENNKISKVDKAFRILYGSDLGVDSRKKILQAMGVINADKIKDKDVLQKHLVTKLTNERDYKVNGERNIDIFLRLAESSEADIDVEALVEVARKLYLIKKSGSEYKFGTQPLGTTLKETYQFLQEERNKEILERLRKDVSDKTEK